MAALGGGVGAIPMSTGDKTTGQWQRFVGWFDSREVMIAPSLLVMLVVPLVVIFIGPCSRSPTDTQPLRTGPEAVLADPPSGATTNPHAINTLLPPEPKPQEVEAPTQSENSSSDVRPGCSGDKGRISVVAIGQRECKVIVGGVALGTAPFVKKESPSGICSVVVLCDGVGAYVKTMTIRPNDNLKVILKPEDFR
jgi:hypothetical protein